MGSACAEPSAAFGSRCGGGAAFTLVAPSVATADGPSGIGSGAARAAGSGDGAVVRSGAGDRAGAGAVEVAAWRTCGGAAAVAVRLRSIALADAVTAIDG